MWAGERCVMKSCTAAAAAEITILHAQAATSDSTAKQSSASQGIATQALTMLYALCCIKQWPRS